MTADQFRILNPASNGTGQSNGNGAGHDDVGSNVKAGYEERGRAEVGSGAADGSHDVVRDGGGNLRGGRSAGREVRGCGTQGVSVM